MHYHLYVYGEWVALLSVTFLSMTLGAAAEKTGAALVLIFNVLGDIAIVVNRPIVPQITLFWLDLVLAAALLVVAFRYSSVWLGVAMILQSVILFCHALALDDDGLSYFAFMLTNNVVSWLMYACLLGATLMSWRARRGALQQGRSAIDFAAVKSTQGSALTT